MQFGILGTVEVLDDDGTPIDVGGAQPRVVLGMLLMAGGRLVTPEAVIDVLWGDDPPPSAAGTVQSYVSRLRRRLEPARTKGGRAEVLVWDPPGYRLAIEPDAVDASRFERLADEGRAALDDGRPADALRLLTEADALWRGPALRELRHHDVAAGAAARLDDRRAAATEDRFEAMLCLGRHAAAAGVLAEAVAAHPLR